MLDNTNSRIQLYSTRLGISHIMFNRLIISVLLVIAGISSANATTIDFETDGVNALTSGTDITGMTLFGATFYVFNQGNAGNSKNGANPGAGIPVVPAGLPSNLLSTLTSGDRKLMLFNANCSDTIAALPNCTGQDPDLSIPDENNPSLGNNILIISEDNNSSDPDDSRFGGNIIIDFDPAVSNLDSLVLDIEESGSYINAYNDGVFLDQILLSTANGGMQTVDFTNLTSEVDRLIVNIEGSGAIVELNFTPVPLPATAWLLGSALLGLFATTKRKAA